MRGSNSLVAPIYQVSQGEPGSSGFPLYFQLQIPGEKAGDFGQNSNVDAWGEPVTLVGKERGLVTDVQARQQVVKLASMGDRHDSIGFAMKNESVGKG